MGKLFGTDGVRGVANVELDQIYHQDQAQPINCTYTFPLLNHALKASGTFWLYAAICVLGYVVDLSNLARHLVHERLDLAHRLVERLGTARHVALAVDVQHQQADVPLGRHRLGGADDGAGVGGADNGAGVAVLHRQFPRRHAEGQGRLDLSAPKRVLHGTPALPGFAQQAGVPLRGPEARHDL